MKYKRSSNKPWDNKELLGFLDQKTDGGTLYRQILIDAKLKTGKRGQKTELNGELH
jgi:hypothetical protein